jgi:predicted ATPase
MPFSSINGLKAYVMGGNDITTGATRRRLDSWPSGDHNLFQIMEKILNKYVENKISYSENMSIAF